MNKHYNASVVIFDDHAIFAETFCMLLEHTALFQHVSVVSGKEPLMRYFAQKHNGPIYFFADYFVPDINMLQTMADVRRLCPSVKVILLTSLTNTVIIKKVLAQKPEAFLSKSVGIPELIDCLDAIANNKPYLSPNIKKLLKGQTELDIPFTPKELEVLEHIALGESIALTAEKLNLSRHTIIAHRRNMMAKIKCNSVTELLAYASSAGLLDNSRH